MKVTLPNQLVDQLLSADLRDAQPGTALAELRSRIEFVSQSRSRQLTSAELSAALGAIDHQAAVLDPRSPTVANLKGARSKLQTWYQQQLKREQLDALDD